MTIIRNVHWSLWVILGLLGGWVSGTALPVHADELKYKAQLIWGTDDEKPANKPKIKDLDPKLRDKIRKVKLFRWKNYFEIDQENFSVPRNSSGITSMSHKCVLELKHLSQDQIEVRLYGKGVLVQTVRQCLPKGEYLILAGDDKDKYNDMWIVAISRTN